MKFVQFYHFCAISIKQSRIQNENYRKFVRKDYENVSKKRITEDISGFPEIRKFHGKKQKLAKTRGNNLKNRKKRFRSGGESARETENPQRKCGLPLTSRGEVGTGSAHAPAARTRS